MYEVIQRAIEEFAAHSARRIAEDQPDEAGIRAIIENEADVALSGVIKWPD